MTTCFLIYDTFFSFLNASKYCGSVLKNDFVVLVVLVLVLVADELLSNFQRIWLFRKSCRNLTKMEICCSRSRTEFTYRLVSLVFNKSALKKFQSKILHFAFLIGLIFPVRLVSCQYPTWVDLTKSYRLPYFGKELLTTLNLMTFSSSIVLWFSVIYNLPFTIFFPTTFRHLKASKYWKNMNWSSIDSRNHWKLPTFGTLVFSVLCRRYVHLRSNYASIPSFRWRIASK